MRQKFLLQFARIFPRRKRVGETHSARLQLVTQRATILHSQVLVKRILANSESQSSQSVSSGCGFQVLFEPKSEPKLAQLAQRVHQIVARKAQQK